MDREKYISWVAELRQKALATAAFFLDADEAEDVAQETLLKMWESLERLDDDKQRLLSYAAMTARNLSQNRLRHKRRHPLMRLLQWHDKEVADTPLRHLETSENDDAFSAAMAKLPYNWQKVLQMRNIDEMSFAEIAAVLGTSESSVRGILSKARIRMVELIKQQI